MQINLVPDSSVAFAPSGLTAAVEAAAAIYEHDFPGNYNVNISYGWGTFDNSPSSVLTSSTSGAYSLGGGTLVPVDYSQLKGWLIASAVSSTQIAAFATLPVSSASLPGDPNSFFVSFAEEKALGVFSGNSGAIDGSIGFNIVEAASTPQDWEPAALTEIAHALGWNSIAGGGSGPTASDLFRYSSPGQYGWASGQPAYFSIDNGNTDLADFATSFDETLFSDLPADDPLRLPFTQAATTLTAFDIEALSVIGFGAATIVSPPPPPRRFMAGGSSPDILWQNADGQAAIWEMNGTDVSGHGTIGANPGPSWTEVGIGDFNDDGHSDILWQNINGQASIWETNGNNIVANGPVGANPGPDWKAVGTGDFNDDGHSDILWQNSDGRASIWDINGTSVISAGPAGVNPGPTWKAIGTGDFNHDSHSDILWQNTATGQVSIWEMDGDTRIGGGLVGADPGPSWTALGTGDFNDDGHSDILWRNANGQTAIWELNGTSVIAHATIASNPGLSWNEVATGDFNGDGHSDILWQNENGQVSIWEMNGTTRIGGGTVSTNPGTSWLAA
jgi:hypothetical protein